MNYKVGDIVWAEAKLWCSFREVFPTGKTIYIGPARIVSDIDGGRMEVRLPFDVHYTSISDNAEIARIIAICPEQVGYIIERSNEL